MWCAGGRGGTSVLYVYEGSLRSAFHFLQATNEPPESPVSMHVALTRSNNIVDTDCHYRFSMIILFDDLLLPKILKFRFLAPLTASVPPHQRHVDGKSIRFILRFEWKSVIM